MRTIIAVLLLMLAGVLLDRLIYFVGMHRPLERAICFDVSADIIEPWLDAYKKNSQNEYDESNLFWNMLDIFNSDQFNSIVADPNQLRADVIFGIDKSAMTYGRQWWYVEGCRIPVVANYWSNTSEVGLIDTYTFVISHPYEIVAEELSILFKKFVIEWYRHDQEKFGLTKTLSADDFVLTRGGQSAAGYFGRYWFLHRVCWMSLDQSMPPRPPNELTQGGVGVFIAPSKIHEEGILSEGKR